MALTLSPVQAEAQTYHVSLVNTTANASQPFTQRQIQDVMPEMLAWLNEATYGSLRPTVIVRDWITLSSTASCPFTSMASYAVSTHGIVFAPGDRHIVVIPPLPCGWSGFAAFTTVWLRDWSLNNAVHELGHTYDFRHPGVVECALTTCATVPGLDPLDVMGTGFRSHYSGPAKRHAGFLDTPTTPPTLRVDVSGTYRLEAFQRSWQGGVKGLRIPATDGSEGGGAKWYFVESRAPSGQDWASPTGVVIRQYVEGASQTFVLVDQQVGPGTSPFLDVGRVFHTDRPGFVVTVETISFDATGAEIRVEVQPTGAVKPTPAAPMVKAVS